MKPALSKLAELGVVKAGIGLYQNEYHKRDVYQHTLLCVEKLKSMSARDTLIAAGYLHDIGKPRLAIPIVRAGKILTDDEGHILHQFKEGHEALGREMVLLLPEELFDDLGINQQEVAEIVGCHYLPMRYFMDIKYVQGRDQLRIFYDKLEKALDNAPAKREDILDIFVADCLAKGNIEPHIPALKLLYGFLREKKDNFEELANLWDIYEDHIKNNTTHLMTSEMLPFGSENN
jgi:hypothetical protein